MAEKQVKVKQIKSTIGRIKKQELVLKAMGLGKIGREKVYADTPVIRGMITKVAHLVQVEEVK